MCFHDVVDIESMPFVEVLGQFSYRFGRSSRTCCTLVHGYFSLENYTDTSLLNMFCKFQGPLLNVVREQVIESNTSLLDFFLSVCMNWIFKSGV